jgi:hypothetical protein
MHRCRRRPGHGRARAARESGHYAPLPAPGSPLRTGFEAALEVLSKAVALRPDVETA